MLEGRSLLHDKEYLPCDMSQSICDVPPCSCSEVVGIPWTYTVVAVKTEELQLHVVAGL